MCDPITIGLAVAGAAASAYGDYRVGKSNRRDIEAAAASYEKERTRQAGFQDENKATLGDTLTQLSRPASDQRVADAVSSRSDSYTAPIQGKNFVADMPADFDPNNVVMARNAWTGTQQKAKSISQALAKAKVDAYGDAQTRGNIIANDNTNKIGMVGRIARGSADAEAMQQGLLPGQLQANQKNAGATWYGIGDALKTASMVSGMSGFGGAHSTFGNFSGNLSLADNPVELGNGLGTLHSGLDVYYPGSGMAGMFENGYNYVSPFGTRIGAAAP